jgi:CRISPR system Cascade subunit CasE
MFLSKLILNPRSRDVQRDLSDCQQMHRTVLSVFPKSETTASARSDFGLLYRVDIDRTTGAAILLVQSKDLPDWNRLFPGYLARMEFPGENPACKPILDRYKELKAGTQLFFRLRANPTRKIDTRSGEDGKRRNGKRIEVINEADQIAWLKRKAEAAGFNLLSISLNWDLPSLQINPEDKSTGWRKNRNNERARLTFGSVLFEGELIITDAELFFQALVKGIGSGKAYGFGLLSIGKSQRS